MIGHSQAIIQKVQTTVDGGLRVTLDFSASDAELAAELMKRAAQGHPVLRVIFEEVESKSDTIEFSELDEDLSL